MYSIERMKEVTDALATLKGEKYAHAVVVCAQIAILHKFASEAVGGDPSLDFLKFGMTAMIARLIDIEQKQFNAFVRDVEGLFAAHQADTTDTVDKLRKAGGL